MSAMAIATYILVTVFSVSYLIFFLVVTIGGFFDLKKLIKSIKEEQVNLLDDGCHSEEPNHPNAPK